VICLSYRKQFFCTVVILNSLFDLDTEFQAIKRNHISVASSNTTFMILLCRCKMAMNNLCLQQCKPHIMVHAGQVEEVTVQYNLIIFDTNIITEFDWPRGQLWQWWHLEDRKSTWWTDIYPFILFRLNETLVY
jgi:hypothetical protein